MRIVFVDDSGSRRPGGTDTYFCLGALSIDSSQLAQLRHRLANIKTQAGLRPLPDDELKFNQIGRNHDTKKKPNPLVRLGMTLPQRRAVGMHLLQTLIRVPTVKLFNVGIDLASLHPGESAPGWAFPILFERIEYSMNEEHERTALVICDEEDTADKLIRDALYTGTGYSRLLRIAETVMFVPSHRSPGVQFADFVAGSGHRWWNYQDSTYLAAIWSAIHTNPQGLREGCGIKSFRGASYPTIVVM